MARILAYVVPAAGHLFPFVPGLQELQRRGHHVHVRTGEKLLATAREAGLDVSPADPGIAAIEVNDYVEGKETDKLRKGLHDMLRRGPLERADLERAIAEQDPDVILVDSLAYGATVAAEASGRRWAYVLPSLLPLPGKGIPPYGLGMKPMGGPLGRARDVVLSKLVERLYARSMLPRLNALRAAAGLRELRSPLEHLLSADRLIILTGEPLEYRRCDLPAKVRMAGAQLWDPPTASPDLAWLDEPGDPWVLVTCSTEYQADEQLALTAVDALRDEPVRVVLTLADASDTVTLPPAPNARVERFVPHGPVLERAAAVVCHSGMGIVQKAIAAGVPIAAVPFGRDQPEVARRVIQAGAGVQLRTKHLTPERLRATVREAIAMRPQAEAASRRLRAAGGGARFADAAEELAREPAFAAA
jgi:UDP:flavonoid glycosyltransferase YjiC (YdhE family)